MRVTRVSGEQEINIFHGMGRLLGAAKHNSKPVIKWGSCSTIPHFHETDVP